mmetsp:Transcript_45621/g.73562  ORF Transcript_45621/g.73562 Transcript_45621/m.73562 type:complete len:92 (+) Transcript_45621:34-309(+)
MLFAIVPFKSLGMGPEFCNNMDSPNNVFGAEDSKAWKYNNMTAPNNNRGMENDKAIQYNNMSAPLNCTGGSEQGCEPFAVARRGTGLAAIY